MKWKIIAVGKPSLAYARQGMEEYLKRLRHYAPVEFLPLKNGTRDEVEKSLLLKSAGFRRIALDERGTAWTTGDFRRTVDTWQADGTKGVACLIGSADGHSEQLRQACDHVVQLSAMTLQHELALVVLLEQIYRIHTIQRGEPYHR